MAIRAVIFDRDGVLTQFDLEAAETFIKPRLNMTAMELAMLWMRWSSVIGTPQSLIEEEDLLRSFWMYAGDKVGVSDQVQRELFNFDYLEVVVPFPDARPALEFAKAQGLKVGVLSNFSLATLNSSLEHVGLLDLVDYAVPAPIIRYAKPHPKSYQHVLSVLGVEPEECLFFDDETPCIEGARALKMASFLVDRNAESHCLDKGIVRDLSAITELINDEKAVV